MKKSWFGFLLFVFPLLGFADEGSLSFAPPPGDYSVIFLGNIFGILGGVLHGSGSQIMGTMFAVFNAAVLALGGIIIMYTLMVSTMNTAHEGQVMGKKWDSMWIPVRSTIGLALLIPKASGYCLMQVFVMWVVVQGVGAADKIWDAALSYLNRGGVIIAAQSNPALTLLSPISAGIDQGAKAILTGQVCMYGLQKQLENQRQQYLQQGNTGICHSRPSFIPASAYSKIQLLCNMVVPDFLNTVNVVSYQSDAVKRLGSNTAFTVPMPNFEGVSPYAALNGVCGHIDWNIDMLQTAFTPDANRASYQNAYNVNAAALAMTQAFTSSLFGSNIGASADSTFTQATNAMQQNIQDNTIPSMVQQYIPQVSAAEQDTAMLSRAIGIQQMYMDLSSVARSMVENDPAFKSTTNASGAQSSTFVSQPFGVPKTAAGNTCQNNQTPDCIGWGAPSGDNGATLFNGTEFMGAVTDYNAIMRPTLTLMQEAFVGQGNHNSRAFITKASSQGWIMAGSYFFDLVNLNQEGLKYSASTETDTNTGLSKSQVDLSNWGAIFGEDGGAQGCVAAGKISSELCYFINNIKTMTAPIINLIQGPPGANVPSPQFKGNIYSVRTVSNAGDSNTVYGFINNSTIVQLPGQPGLKALKFADVMDISVNTSNYYLPEETFACGRVRIMVFSFCLGQMLGDLFYNTMFRTFYNTFLSLFNQFINQVIMAFLLIPLQGMSHIFQQGLQIIAAPNVNPVVALAQMGTYYINFAANLWVELIEMSITSVLLPFFGVFIFVLIGMALPILLAWLGTMVGIGMVTAYYVPLLPYMIFTFGSIAWLMAVIEAMVAAPIVALGVTHPEGHEAFGKGEHAVMILMNVFLRPAMMIIGYIAGISLSYVGIWILNAGFDHAVAFVQGSNEYGTLGAAGTWGAKADLSTSGDGGGLLEKTGYSGVAQGNRPAPTSSVTGGYSSWAGIFAFFFSILIYTYIYWTIVEKAFTLISSLPDKVLRWIGGQQEQLGQESAGWTEQGKQKVKEAGDSSSGSVNQMGKTIQGYGQKAMGGAKKAMSDSGGSQVNLSSKSPDSGGGGGGGGGGAPGAGGVGME